LSETGVLVEIESLNLPTCIAGVENSAAAPEKEKKRVKTTQLSVVFTVETEERTLPPIPDEKGMYESNSMIAQFGDNPSHCKMTSSTPMMYGPPTNMP
jgi:hypothetical protein